MIESMYIIVQSTVVSIFRLPTVEYYCLAGIMQTLHKHKDCNVTNNVIPVLKMSD